MKVVKLSLLAFSLASSAFGQKMNVEVDTKAKVYCNDSIVIHAPINKVYTLISSVSNWPTWLTEVKKVQMEGTPQEGKEFVWKASGFRIKSRFHTVRPDTEVGWTGKMWWVKVVHNWHFEPTPNDGTKVVVKESMKGFGTSLMKNSLKKDMKRDLADLKKEAEKTK